MNKDMHGLTYVLLAMERSSQGVLVSREPRLVVSPFTVLN